MTAAPLRRAKYTTMIGVLAASGLALLASTQTWYSYRLAATANHSAAVIVQGSVAAPALTALALAGLAFTAALAIAGRIIRLVLGVLGLVIGVAVLISAFTAIGDPVQAGSSAITTATGVAGSTSVAHLVEHVDAAVWPWCAVAGGVLLVLAALGVLATGHRWPGASRRYQTVRFEPAVHADAADDETDDDDDTDSGSTEAGNARDTAIDRWDELSRGEDPTR